MAAVTLREHVHTPGAGGAIAAAEACCSANRLRLTATRRRVLEILIEERKALGAYAILARLAREGRGGQPSVVYRALDFLLQHGFVHKIELLNAYAACTRPNEKHIPAFVICSHCSAVIEVLSPLPEAMFGRLADEIGFRIERMSVEAVGVCPACIPVGAAR